MVTVEELFNITDKTSRLRVFEEGQQAFIGYMFDLIAYTPELWGKWRAQEVKKFKFCLDIKHKKWQELGLMAPLEPENVATYQFSDLQTELYYEIYL